jgi:hypothetical protein
MAEAIGTMVGMTTWTTVGVTMATMTMTVTTTGATIGTMATTTERERLPFGARVARGVVSCMARR